MDTIREKAFALLLVELEKAEKKHPYFLGGNAGVSVITEELGELAQVVNDNALPSDRYIEEAAHVAVTAMRFIEQTLEEKEFLDENH